MANEHNTPIQLNQAGRSRGFMLLGLLILLALSGISLMAMVDVWTLQRQREREAQLLFVGDQYRLAIQRYYFAAPPGTPRVLPVSTKLLLEDDRYPIPVRHLRRLYPDPITGTAEWGEVRVGDRLSGVYSLSEAQPIKQAGFTPTYEIFNTKSSYREWIFSFTGPSALGAGLPPTPSSSTSPVFGNPK
jgi:type II secretory pathway pseudopilin PulG